MLDKKTVRRGFERAAPRFDERDFLHREVRERLIARLPAIRLDAERVVDLGAGTGGAVAALTDYFAGATVIPVDLTHAMLAAGPAGPYSVCADAAQLPFPDQSVDVVFSNLMLHHCPDPAAVMAETRRILKSPGVLLFTTLGRDSLLELGRAWATADRHTHVFPFGDLHGIGDEIVRAGFSEPVFDSQTLTLRYGSFENLVADLRNAGAINATEHRNPGLTGRNAGRTLRAAWDAQAGEDGRTPLTLDLIFGVAWAGEGARRRQAGEPIEIPIDHLRRTRTDRS